MFDATTIYLATAAATAAVFGCSYSIYTLRRIFGKSRRARTQDWYYRDLITRGYKSNCRAQSSVRFYLVNRWE